MFVFRRDGWLCRWCGRPVVFAPVMRYLERYARQLGYTGPLAYFDPRWRRDKAPLLDHLAAVIDHEKAFSIGGGHDAANFVTACNKCNVRKSADTVEGFTRRSPMRRVKGKYGEPNAHFGHGEQPDRSMVNAPIGDRDRSGATLGVRG